VCDWNNDGRKDLLVADGRGWLFLYLNTGSDAAPVLEPGARVQANGKPIHGTARASVLVCDWDRDGKKDVILGMGGEDELSDYYDWPHLNTADPSQDRGFLFYKNTGTDASPVLAAPKWITAGTPAAVVTYPSRPNLGSFIDWDGDGDRDFIACGFENNAQLFVNTLGPVPNSEPRLSAGVTIVQPWTFQMMSGADAVDWNRDGDIDIITGQGHGGSGVRFYERDYINDFMNQTFPIVTVGQSESLAIAPDLDNDGDVDQQDFGLFQSCLSGNAYGYAPGCAAADLDLDGDVDYDDLLIFEQCRSGPGQPPVR